MRHKAENRASLTTYHTRLATVRQPNGRESAAAHRAGQAADDLGEDRARGREVQPDGPTARLAARRPVYQHDPRLREEELGRTPVRPAVSEQGPAVGEQGPAGKPGQACALWGSGANLGQVVGEKPGQQRAAAVEVGDHVVEPRAAVAVRSRA